MKKLALGIALAGLLVTACGGSQVSPFAYIASSNGNIGVGDQRVLVALVDPETDELLASEDRAADMTLRDQNGAPIETYPMFFVETVAARGLYGANVFIPEAGTYQVTIDADGLNTAGPVGLVTSVDPMVIQVGEPAPLSITRTAADYPDLSVISSDPEPDPEMYRLSVDEAVSNGTPSVVIFATPAWCSSQTCGPLLEQIKTLRTESSGVDFVHVEVYDDIQVSTFEDLVTVESVRRWGLPAEPWVFVIDSTGMVTGSFEGAATDEELKAAIEVVAP